MAIRARGEWSLRLVQLAGGLLLIGLRPSGFVVVLLGMLLSAPFWWGFDLPLAWLNAALLLPFLAAAWTVYGKPHVIRARAAGPQPKSSRLADPKRVAPSGAGVPG